jgi:hypothetical protein
MSSENQATIPVYPDTRDRVREIKGHERSYDDLLNEWADMAEENA